MVHGITLQVWEHEDETVAASKKWQERGCCKVGIAKHVAKILNISHEVIDTRDSFRKGVIDDFLHGYTTGTTPNPCVRCNERVKIRGLVDLASSRGSLCRDWTLRSPPNHQGTPVLARAADDRKGSNIFSLPTPPSLATQTPLPSGRSVEIGRLERSRGLRAPGRRAEGKSGDLLCHSRRLSNIHRKRRFPKPKNLAYLSMQQGSLWANMTELHSTHLVNAEVSALPQDNASMFNRCVQRPIPSARPGRITPQTGVYGERPQHFCRHIFWQTTRSSGQSPLRDPPTPAILSPVDTVKHPQFSFRSANGH